METDFQGPDEPESQAGGWCGLGPGVATGEDTPGSRLRGTWARLAEDSMDRRLLVSGSGGVWMEGGVRVCPELHSDSLSCGREVQSTVVAGCPNKSEAQGTGLS